MIETALSRAQAGDGEAFRELVEPYSRELQAHCYRILGSVQDAEDVLQEALLAAWRSIGHFDGRLLRAWLYRIATNRCLNYLRGESRRPRRPACQIRNRPGQGGSGPATRGGSSPTRMCCSATWTPAPRPAMTRGSRSRCRSWPACSTCRPSSGRSWYSGMCSAFRRPKPPASSARPRQPFTARSSGPGGLRPDTDPHDVPLPQSAAEAAVIGRFVDAFERSDVDALVALLTEDARLAMPPEPFEFRGPQAIAAFLRETHIWGQELKIVPTRANNQPALAFYLADPCTPLWRASSLVVLTLQGNQGCVLTRFGDRGLLARFGLPRTLPRD